MALQDQGKLYEAIKNYRIVVQIDPKYAEAYFNMGKNNRIKNKYYKNVKVDVSFVE